MNYDQMIPSPRTNQIRSSKNYEQLPDSEVGIFAVKTGQLNMRHLKWKTRLQMKYLHDLAL